MRKIQCMFMMASVLWNVATFAAAVKLDMNLKTDTQSARPQLIAQFGETAMISHNNSDSSENYEMSVVVSRLKKMSVMGEESVKMSFVIKKVVGDVKTIISQPQIITKFGHKATISQTNSDGKKVELTVVPTLE